MDICAISLVQANGAVLGYEKLDNNRLSDQHYLRQMKLRLWDKFGIIAPNETLRYNIVNNQTNQK
jgi:hypothetical protein